MAKDFLGLFLPCPWCYECAPSTASMKLWICKGEWPKSPEHVPLAEAVLRCRFSIHREGNFTSSFSLDPSLQMPPVVPDVSTSWNAAQHYLFWEQAVTPHWPGRGNFLGFHVISVTEGQNSFIHTYCTLVWAWGKQWTEAVLFL